MSKSKGTFEMDSRRRERKRQREERGYVSKARRGAIEKDGTGSKVFLIPRDSNKKLNNKERWGGSKVRREE